MRKFVILFFVLILSSCSVKNYYNPVNIEQEKLAKVNTFRKDIFADGYYVYIEYIWNSSKEEITKRNHWIHNKLREFSLPAGEYEFQVRCDSGFNYALPKAKFVLEAGKQYELYCEIEKGKNMFGWTVDAYASARIREINKRNKASDGTQ